MATDKGLRKPCQSGGGKCAQRHGTKANRKGGCCCGADCTTVWKATPCFAGQTSGEICGCPAAYPSEVIYVCTDAKCLCDGPPIGTTILAEYSHTPGVKWCFTVNKTTTYLIEDVPPEATIVGGPTSCVDCIAGCSASQCPAARGRFIRPKNCDHTQPAHCPWICPADVTACRVNSMSWWDNGVAQSGCCHLIDGPVEERYFETCPDPYDDWGAYCISGDCPKSCCGCVSGCGGTQTIQEFVSSCPGHQVCAEVNPSPSECCCGDCPGTSVTFSEHYRLDWLNVEEYFRSGTCQCDGSGTYDYTSCRDGDCNTQTYPCSNLYSCAGGLGGIGSTILGIGISCFGACPSPDFLSNVTSGSWTASCDDIVADVTNTIVYTAQAGGGTYIQRLNGFVHWNRQIGPNCTSKCADGQLKRPGRGRHRIANGSTPAITSGSGAFM